MWASCVNCPKLLSLCLQWQFLQNPLSELGQIGQCLVLQILHLLPGHLSHRVLERNN